MTSISDAERPRFLTDEDFNLTIVAGLRRARPQMDIESIQSTELVHASDPLVLAFAKDRDRILLSHDMKTMPNHFAAFLASLPSGEHSPGIILVPQAASVGTAILWLVEIWEASRHDEWRDLPTRLPL